MPEPSPSATLSHVARSVRGLVDDADATAHVAVGLDDARVLRVATSDGPCPAIGGVLASDGPDGEPDPGSARRPDPGPSRRPDPGPSRRPDPGEAWYLITDAGAEPVQAATARFGSQSVGVALQTPSRRAVATTSLSATAELAARALHGATLPLRDPVTGALSRRAFFDDLDARLRGHPVPLAVLLCSINSADAVIDSLGRSTADALRRVAYRRLREAAPAGAPIAHLGSDEFALVTDAADAPAVADAIVEALSASALAEGTEVPVRTSVGLAESAAGVDAATLLRQAHLAARRARQADGAQWARFTGEWHSAAIEGLADHRDLGRALDRGELLLHYQPVVRATRTGMVIVGMEALLRWQHPTRGLIPPDAFIPVAEQTGLIVPIGRWVLREACRRHIAWQHDMPRALGVNISAAQLASPRFVDDVREVLAETGLPPSSLALEITETTASRDPDLAAARLADLRQLGVQVALDDFGTGYSSLTHLQQLPATILKLDQSFVAQVGVSNTGTRMAEAVLSLARTLGLDTVAEGVERPEQVAALRQLGYEFLQGFWLHRPLTAPAVDELVAPREPLGA